MKKPIRVLEVIRQGQIGGGESHVLDLIAGLDRSEVEPIAMAYTGGHMIESLKAQGIKCYVVETGKAFDPKVFGTISEIIQKEKIDLIHAHGSRAASNLLWSAWRLHIPMIYTVHGWSFHQDQSTWMQKARAWSEKLICSRCQKVICVSESNRQSGIEAFGLQNCTVIENGINLKRFNAEGHYPDLRQAFNFQPHEFVVGFVARMTLQKAPIDFLKGIQLAHTKNPLIKGLLVGEGDMEDEVKQYIHTHKMENYIKTSPFRTDIPSVLHALDVYCLPSLWEGLSIALLEAMAMKKALVVTPTDGTKEIINNNQNGIITDFQNPEELAKAFIRYADHPELVTRYGENAFRLIKTRFDSQRVSDEVTQIYFNILTTLAGTPATKA